MEQKAQNFIENQFKAAGVAEAFTPELIAKLDTGIPYLKHPFAKAYEKDEVQSHLYLKKSSNSDNYFLNKMDLEVKKEGQDQTIKQSFYLTDRQLKDKPGNDEGRQSQKYTFKKAYNLVAGRPVYDHVNDSWQVMNLRNILSNGNHKIEHYSKNYGFNLEDVFSKYPIKELQNDQYKQSLKDSIERGNLQKATLTDKDGKELSFYITPNIKAGSFDMYDLNKQRVPTERLLQDGLIDKTLGEKLINYQNLKRTGELKEDTPKVPDSDQKPKIKDELIQHQKQTLKPEKPKQKQREKIK